MPELQDAFLPEAGSGLRVDPAHQPMTVSSPVASFWTSIALPTVVVLLVLIQIGICWKALPTSLRGRVDFRAFYAAGHLLMQGRGHELYSYTVQQQTQDAIFPAGFKTLPFLYPAYAAGLFAPYGLLPYREAFFVFGGFNLVGLGIAGRLLSLRVPALKRLPLALQYGLLLAFFPVSIALMQGQISVLLLLLYLALERLLTRRMYFVAGLVLALGLVKFQVALPVAVLLLAWGYYRLIAGFVCGAVGLALASLALCGREGMIAYWQSTSRMANSTLVDPAAAKLRYGMFAGDMPNLHGLFFTLAQGRLLGVEVAAVASIAVMLWAWRQRPSIAVALPAAMLISYHMQAYDLVLLLLPLMVVLGRLSDVDRPARLVGTPIIKTLLVSTVLLLTVPLAAYLLVKGLSSLMALAVLFVLIAGRNVGGDTAVPGQLNRFGLKPEPILNLS